MVSGYSGGLRWGSHPKKVGLALTPVSTNSDDDTEIGGNSW